MGIDPLSRPLSFAPLSPPPLSEARLARLARAREWRWQLGLACLASLLWTLALALLGGYCLLRYPHLGKLVLAGLAWGLCGAGPISLACVTQQKGGAPSR